MNFLVMLEESAGSKGSVLAHVNSVPDRLDAGNRARDIVTLYGEPDSAGLALALAAAVESHRQGGPERAGVIRHLGVWLEKDAVGDSAWRDGSGELVSHDLHIPLDRLRATAEELLRECGAMFGRLLAGLRMPDWPEGARRAISVTLDRSLVLPGLASAPMESVLEAMREGDGDWWNGVPEGC